MNIINPATDEILKTIEEDNSQSIQKKFEEALQGQRNWKKVLLKDRVACIEKFKELLILNCERLAGDLTNEVGKPLQESRNEVQGAASKLNFFLEQSVDILTKKQVHNDGTTNELLGYDPLGVVANISAWNYPFLVGVNIFIPALIAGNSVLYKPSEFATLTGLNIADLLYQSGVPKDVFIPILGGAETGKALLDQPINGVFFTGSYQTGKKIAEAVASRLIPIGLELGGKDPLYVTDEVDIQSAAENAAEGAFYNNGQSCCSVERIYIHKSIYDQFTKDFIEATQKLKVGDPMDPNTNMGAITRKVHLKYLEAQVQDAVKKGAKLECGGEIIDGSGSFFTPTVLTHVDHSMDVMREETFGPVIGLMKVEDDAEAIRLMNDTQYGLTSSVFSKNGDRGQAILAEVDSGTGYLNCCDRVSGYLPWSGRGHSGLGSTLSAHGLYAFTQPKGIQIRS